MKHIYILISYILMILTEQVVGKSWRVSETPIIFMQDSMIIYLVEKKYQYYCPESGHKTIMILIIR